MYRLVAFRYRAGAGPARTMKFSMLASGASEHRLAFADMDQQRRPDGLHRRAVGNLAAMITKWVDRTGFVMTSSSPPGKGAGCRSTSQMFWSPSLRKPLMNLRIVNECQEIYAARTRWRCSSYGPVLSGNGRQAGALQMAEITAVGATESST